MLLLEYVECSCLVGDRCVVCHSGKMKNKMPADFMLDARTITYKLQRTTATHPAPTEPGSHSACPDSMLLPALQRDRPDVQERELVA